MGSLRETYSTTAQSYDRCVDLGSTEVGSIRGREKRVPATISAIADAIRWAEEISAEIDRRWPMIPAQQPK
jgi:hypothetical protein